MDGSSQAADRFAKSVITHRKWWLIAWLALAVGCYVCAPTWLSIALDGDFDHLPAGLASVEGDHLLDAAFPSKRARSQMAVVIGRDNAPLDEIDRLVSLDLSRRFQHAVGEARLQAAVTAGWQPDQVASVTDPVREILRESLDPLNQAISLDKQLFEGLAALPDGLAAKTVTTNPRLKIAFADRALVHRSLGDEEHFQADRDAVAKLTSAQAIISINQRPPSPLHIVVNALVPEDPIVGHRLKRPKVQLILLRLQTELGGYENIAALEAANRVVGEARSTTGKLAREGLRIEITGSAAVGAEAQRASADAIRYTEVFTVLLVLVILAVVYRAPLLVGVPILSIGVAVVVASGLIALTVVGGRALGPGFPHPEVFVTSRIFVFVIVFGVGTDFCLFLISRLREESQFTDWNSAVTISLSRTLGALVGSALTTVLGLGTMILATFGKFHHTGPVIAICLLITLATCITFTPSLLRWLGPRVFWPVHADHSRSSSDKFWVHASGLVTRYPGWILTFGIFLLLVPAIYGWKRQDAVTYDFVSQLSPAAPARRGAELLASEFPAGETNPISVVVYRDGFLEKADLEEAVRHLADKLYLPGVSAVRSLQNPLGDAPGKKAGLFDADAWRRRALQSHQVSRAYFISDLPDYRGRLARFDVVPNGDPFGQAASNTLTRVLKLLDEQSHHPGSKWYQARYAVAGTTASIQDLRTVTIRDTKEIQISVVVAVLMVLLVIVRRVVLSVYLIFTVLISYFATLGITLLFFRWTGGDSFVGLDWKLPVFLFVILVAVGQDYNVYLVTRVLEETGGGNFKAGLRRAVARTGGIITSCGVVMAGTFFTMTSASWVPTLFEWVGFSDGSSRPLTLASITQLGFALGVGVLLDTFYVRPILVPAFMALTHREPTARR